MATVRFTGSRADVVRIARQLGGILSGREPDRGDIGRSFLITLGFRLLSDVKAAFITKARGGTDEMGIRWPKLSKEYLAYGRRFGTGEQAKLKRAAGLGSGHRRAPGNKKGLLTGAQLKFWRRIYSQSLLRFELSEGTQAAKSHAAAVAWIATKRIGGKTKLEVFGNRDVDILRDQGFLLNSLGPGIPTIGPGASYTPPGGEGGEQQIFDIEPGAVTVGTNIEYASKHQKGDGVPQRKFLPDESTPVPAVWWARMARAANKALVASVVELFRRGRAA